MDIKLNLNEILYWDIREMSRKKGLAIEDYCIDILNSGIMNEKKNEILKLEGRFATAQKHNIEGSINEIANFRIVKRANEKSRAIFLKAVKYIKEKYDLFPVEKKNTIVYKPNVVAFEYLGKRATQVQISLMGLPESFSFRPKGELKRGRNYGWSRYNIISEDFLPDAYKLVDEAFSKKKGG